MFGTQHHQLYNSSSLKNNFNGARSTELPSGQKRPHHFSHGHKFQNNGQFYNNGFRGTNGRDNYLQHWCETCDRGFKTAEMLENHISEHQVRVVYVKFHFMPMVKI